MTSHAVGLQVHPERTTRLERLALRFAAAVRQSALDRIARRTAQGSYAARTTVRARAVRTQWHSDHRAAATAAAHAGLLPR